MAKNSTLRLLFILFLALVGALIFGFVISTLLSGKDVALLDPKGIIASAQHNLMLTSTLIMLAFGVPIILTLYFFVWKFRESNQSSVYNPVSTNSKAFLAFAWGGPITVVIILA